MKNPTSSPVFVYVSLLGADCRKWLSPNVSKLNGWACSSGRHSDKFNRITMIQNDDVLGKDLSRFAQFYLGIRNHRRRTLPQTWAKWGSAMGGENCFFAYLENEHRYPKNFWQFDRHLQCGPTGQDRKRSDSANSRYSNLKNFHIFRKKNWTRGTKCWHARYSSYTEWCLTPACQVSSGSCQ